MAKRLENTESMLSESTKAHIKEASDNTVDATFGAVRGSIPGVVTAVKSGVESISESVEAVKGLNDDMRGRTLKEKASVVKEFAQTSMQSTADSVIEKPGEYVDSAKEIIAVGSGQKSIRDAIDRAAEAKREKAERLEKLDAARKESADERVNKKKNKSPSIKQSTFFSEHDKLTDIAAQQEALDEMISSGASQNEIDEFMKYSNENVVHNKSERIEDMQIKYPVIKEVCDKGDAINATFDGPSLQDGFDGPKMPNFV